MEELKDEGRLISFEKGGYLIEIDSISFEYLNLTEITSYHASINNITLSHIQLDVQWWDPDGNEYIDSILADPDTKVVIGFPRITVTHSPHTYPFVAGETEHTISVSLLSPSNLLSNVSVDWGN